MTPLRQLALLLRCCCGGALALGAGRAAGAAAVGARDRPDRHADCAAGARRLTPSWPLSKPSGPADRGADGADDAARGHRGLRAARRRGLEDRSPRGRRRPADRGGQGRPPREIATAKALEGAVPDLAARQIIDRRDPPAFRADDYAGGIDAAVDQLIARIKGEALPAPARTPPAQGAVGGLQPIELLIFAFVARAGAGTVSRGDLRPRPRLAGQRRRRRLRRLAGHAEPAVRRRRCVHRPAVRSVRRRLGVLRTRRPPRGALVGGGGGGGGWSGGGRRRRLLVRRRWRLRRRRRRQEAGAWPSCCASSSTAGSTSATRARARRRRAAAPRGPRARQRAVAQRRDPLVRRGRPAAVLPVEGPAAHATARSRCSASCGSGTPKPTTAC